MQVALEKLPLEERVSLLKQLWESIKQDDPEALKFARDDMVINEPHRLNALPDLIVPDAFDDIEVTDFDESNLNQDIIKNEQTDNEVGVFDEFFGILRSDKSVTLADMDKAIAMEGGKL